MALFQTRKTRTSRAAEIKPSSSIVRRSVSSLQNRAVFARLSLTLIALVAIVGVVQGWKPPFPFRLGDRVDHGITASVDFERPNIPATQLARLEAENRVPYFFVRDAIPFETLPNRLRVGLNDVAQAATLSDLSPQTRAAFGLVLPEAGASRVSLPPDDMNQDFRLLKSSLTQKEGTAGNRIDDLLSEFERFISPLRETGLADPAEMDRIGIRPEQSITVVSATQPNASLIVPSVDVVLPTLLKDTGLIGKSWNSYTELRPIRPLLERWMMSQAPISLRYDSAATQKARQEARENTKPVDIRYNAGNVLLPAGKPIDEETLDILRAEHEEMEREISTDQRIARLITVFLMLCVLGGLNGYYLSRSEPRIIRGLGRLSLYLVCVVAAIGLGRALSFDPWRAEVIPIVVTSMVFAVAYNQVLATLLGMTVALVVTVSTVGDLSQLVVLLTAVATSVIPLSNVPSRSSIIKVGFAAGVAYFLVACGVQILENQSDYAVWRDTSLLFSSLRGAGWCLVSGYLVAGSLPFIEKTFGVVTDISLLEMSDISHPLLQELVRRAPGTYNHSIAVATIGETAADRIGANGLLVRVGAYYHDIGKMLKPHYFIENMTEGSTSRHENLAPAMSTLIIIGHVKDGVDLARRHNLPQPLVDFIEQHHGTTLVEYFFREAKHLADQTPDHKRDVEESAFRYPGPKPQTRELGVMMIADAVESASRTLGEPTPKRIEGLVHSIIMKRLLDGQFDECNLTLNELRIVEESLTKSLIGIYHGRIKYPEQQRIA